MWQGSSGKSSDERAALCPSGRKQLLQQRGRYPRIHDEAFIIAGMRRSVEQAMNEPRLQGVARGRLKESDHFFHFLRFFWRVGDVFSSRFLPNSFCRTPFAAGWHLAHAALNRARRATTRLLRRVPRRLLETAFDKVLSRRVLRCLAVGFRGKKEPLEGTFEKALT